MQPSICPTEKQIELNIEISTVNLRYRLHATLNLPVIQLQTINLIVYNA